MHIRDIKTLQAFKKEISLLEDKEYKNSNYDFQLEKKWITGGIGGGSCWDEPGDEPHYELCEQDEPKDNTISTILKNFLPEISIEVFLKMMMNINFGMKNLIQNMNTMAIIQNIRLKS